MCLKRKGKASIEPGRQTITTKEFRSKVPVVGSALPCNGHLAKGRDPLLKRGVSAEERGEYRAYSARKRRFDDAKRGGRLWNRARNALVVGPQLLQGTDQAVRLADHARARFVGRVFALTRDA